VPFRNDAWAKVEQQDRGISRASRQDCHSAA
jgi:hypothetical protein